MACSPVSSILPCVPVHSSGGSHCWPGAEPCPPHYAVARLEADARSPHPSTSTAPSPPNSWEPCLHFAAAAQDEPWSHSVILLPSRVPPPSLPLLPRPLLQHTHGLAQLVRAQKASITVCRGSWRQAWARHFCWVGTKGSLVRLLQTSPSSFPTSTFGCSPCPHLPVKSRILPPRGHKST